MGRILRGNLNEVFTKLFFWGVGGSGRSPLECTTFEIRAVALAIAVESCWGSSGGGIALQSSKYDDVDGGGGGDDDDDDDDPRNRSGNATPVRIVYFRSPEKPDRPFRWQPDFGVREEESEIVIGLGVGASCTKLLAA